MQIVILAAGVGSRLGQPFPKSLTPLADGHTIMGRQMEAFRHVFPDATISTVVGFKKDVIMEAFPDVSYVYNENFGETNTSKSLLKALRQTSDSPVLWLNGDVVFDESVLEGFVPLIAEGNSFVCVNTARVGDEEVKYTADDDGFVTQLSKSVTNAAGEAVGINFVASGDKPSLIAALDDCDDNDYFERGIEIAIERGSRFKIAIVDPDSLCIEIDFPADLTAANEALEH